MNLQDQLNEAYQPLVTRIAVYERLGQSEVTDNMLRDLNGPFLIAVDEQYEVSKPKVIIVGQENDRWLDDCTYYEFLERGKIEDVLDVYRRFNIAEFGSGCFGRYFAEIRDRIIGGRNKAKERAVIWTNLFKLNQGMTHMIHSPYLEGVLKLQGQVFQQEIMVLRPEVVIFLTGPEYDDTIRHFYPGAAFVPFGGCCNRELAQVSATGLPELSFRTYHPGYVNRDRGSRFRYYEAIITAASGSRWS